MSTQAGIGSAEQQPAQRSSGTFLAYALVLVLAIECALWGAFLVPLRGLGVPLPVAPVLAVVGNVVCGVAGARVLRSRVGAILPGLIWAVIALSLGTRTAEGDVVVPGTAMGVAFLVAGTVAATAVIGVVGDQGRGRATPGAVLRR